MLILFAVSVALPLGFFAYAYAGYPAILWIGNRLQAVPGPPGPPSAWPEITITVPCYNESRTIASTLEGLLALEYPAGRRHLLVISDASTDGTDEIVRSFAHRGVELLSLPTRQGKTAAENAAAAHLRGTIAVNTDATIRVAPGGLMALVAALEDPTVGVASGRDVSVGNLDSAGNQGESGYVGYEMWIRSLETKVGGIVGASGCFFATRRELYATDFPLELSRDFASCLIAREQGYRAVSVEEALAFVPRAPSLRVEYRRKVRTMARGLGTLHYKRHLLNPFRFGRFAWMLFSHKLCRWLFQLALPLLLPGAVFLGLAEPRALPWLLAAGAGTLLLAAAAWRWPDARPMPRLLAAPGYFLWSNLAGVMAWLQFFRGRYQPIWEPTRRPDAGTPK